MEFYAPMFVGTGIILLALLALMAAPEIRAAQRRRRELLDEAEEEELDSGDAVEDDEVDHPVAEARGSSEEMRQAPAGNSNP